MEEKISQIMKSISRRMEKKAASELGKLENIAEKRLKKAEKKNPRSFFVVKNSLGKNLANLIAGRYFRQVETLLKQDNQEKAEKVLRLVMRWNPLFAPAWLTRAKFELRNKHEKEAILYVTCALKLDPGFTEAIKFRAEVEKQLELSELAMMDFLQLSEKCPNDLDALLALTEYMIEQGYLEAAEPYLLWAYELKPLISVKMRLVQCACANDDLYKTVKLGRTAYKEFWKEMLEGTDVSGETFEQRMALLDKKPVLNGICKTKDLYCAFLKDFLAALYNVGDEEEIQKVCEEIIYMSPEDSFAKTTLAKILIGLGEDDRAMDLLKEIREEDFEYPFACWQLAELLYEKGDWEETLKYYQITIHKKYRVEDSFHKIIFCLNKLGKDDEILELCTKLIAQGIKGPELHYVRGSLQFMKEQIDKALDDWLIAIRMDPKNSLIWFSLAMAYVKKSMLDKAGEAAKHALQLNPSFREAGVILLQILDVQRNYDEMYRVLDEMIQNVSPKEDFMILKGDLLCRKCRNSEAMEILNEVLELCPNHPIALASRSEVWQNEENWQKAYEDISAAIQAAPDISRFYLTRAVCEAYLKDFQHALEDCEVFLSHNPDNIGGILFLGTMKLELKQPEAAIVLFQEVLKKNPWNVDAILKCIRAKREMNLFESALEDADRLMEMDSRDDNFREVRFVLLLDLKREAEALEYCQKILEDDPNCIPIHYDRGTILLNTERQEEALQEFEWVCEHDPQSIKAHFARALALNALFRHDEAMEALNLVLKINPDFIPALSEKAMTYSSLGNVDFALELFDKVLEKMPNDVRILNMCGTLLAYKRCYDEAKEKFRKALEIQPDHAISLSNLGHVLQICGELEEGLQTLTLAIRYDSDLAKAYLSRAEIYMKMYSLEEARQDIDMARQKAQTTGDEDALVRAYDESQKLKILEQLLNFRHGGDDDDTDLDEWKEEDDTDDWQDESDDKDMDFTTILKKYIDILNKEKQLEKNLHSLDDSSLEDTEDDSDDDLDDGDDDFDEDDFDEDDEDSFIDWDSWDSCDDWDDDSEEDLRKELEENPEDFDFSVDCENEQKNLTSEFMQLEKILSCEVPIREATNENQDEKKGPVTERNDSHKEAVPEDDGSEIVVKRVLHYLDLTLGEDSGGKKDVTPGQVQQAADFLSWVFQLWDSEKMEERPKPDEETEEGEKDISYMSPVVINCPEIVQKHPEKAMILSSSEVPKELNSMVPMAVYIRYKENREFFFEQLMDVSDILNQAMDEAKTVDQKCDVLHRKGEFGFLMKLVMNELVNRENEILLVFTNFLTESVMDELKDLN